MTRSRTQTALEIFPFARVSKHELLRNSERLAALLQVASRALPHRHEALYVADDDGLGRDARGLWNDLEHDAGRDERPARHHLGRSRLRAERGRRRDHRLLRTARLQGAALRVRPERGARSGEGEDHRRHDRGRPRASDRRAPREAARQPRLVPVRPAGRRRDELRLAAHHRAVRRSVPGRGGRSERRARARRRRRLDRRSFARADRPDRRAAHR